MEPMLDMFLFESAQLIEQLEQIILQSEKADEYSADDIGEIFRIMHTIKGASAMMMFDNIAGLAHSIEDVFFYVREAKPAKVDCARLSDMILAGIDFVKAEFAKIQDGSPADGDASALTGAAKSYLEALKAANPLPAATQKAGDKPAGSQQYYISQQKAAASGPRQCYRAVVFFEDGCGLENIRAYTLLQALSEIAAEVRSIPDGLMEDDSTAAVIGRDGLRVEFATDRPYGVLEEFFNKTILLKRFELAEAADGEAAKQAGRPRQIVLDDPPVKIPAKGEKAADDGKDNQGAGHQTMISVNVLKMDRLMDLVGELVIAEAMVTQNPDLRGLALGNFSKAVRQLEKITGELQDTVMSMRMLPLTATFHKMLRVVRDMCKKLGKDVKLELIGAETEVDKNIIEHISDPLMHLIRNAVDHGIEAAADRAAAGKAPTGQVTLEAKNDGSDVVIMIKDDGWGLNKEKILKRARENGLVHKPESELSDREIYSFIFAPGFSTKEKVTEFSGRGVGMDVVVQNINSIGGMVLVDSVSGAGTTITLKIPLTLAIVDGMMIGVGAARYTIPTTAIKDSFRPKGKEVIVDPDGNEMIMVRGQCYPILRLHKMFRVNDATSSFTDGIVIMVEKENDAFCLFADQLIGEQQVVVKALPAYIRNIRHVEGLAGCALLGDGSISLILDVGGLRKREGTYR